MRPAFFMFCVCLLVGVVLVAGGLVQQAWTEVRVRESAAEVQKAFDLSPMVAMLNLQMKQARQKLERLEPGPEPSWLHPLKHAEWEVKMKVYGEAHEALNDLLKQKRAVLGEAERQSGRVRMVWNGGIAPILHVLLAGTLLLLALRWGLRLALVNGVFGWTKL